MEQRSGEYMDRRESEQQQGYTRESDTLRPSGESQNRHTALDLPPQRSLTPINLGFSMPGTPVGDKTELQSLPRQTTSSQPTTRPARPDPRRPVQRQPGDANENTHPARNPSQSSTGSSISKLDKTDKTSSEWEVLSDAESRLNEGDAVVVAELQKKVDKRRSNFQYLADELAALDAQIKAAEEREERLKRAQAQGGPARGNETQQQ